MLTALSFPEQELWRELQGSPTLAFDERGFTATRVFKVHASILMKFCLYLKGSPSREIGPDPFPNLYNTPLDRVMATRVQASPFSGARGDRAKADATGNPTDKHLMTSEWWQIQASYDTPFSVDYTFAGEFLSVPTDQLVFSDGTPINNLINVGKVIPQLELTIKRNGLASLKPRLIAEALGCVNNTPFNPLELENDWRNRIGLQNSIPTNVLVDTVHARGTVLLNAVRVNMVSDPFGTLTWNAEFHFLIRANYAPWNKVFNALAAAEGVAEATVWQTMHKAVYSSPDVIGPPSLGYPIELYKEKDLQQVVRQ
jgi:hypothetical protein